VSSLRRLSYSLSPRHSFHSHHPPPAQRHEQSPAVAAVANHTSVLNTPAHPHVYSTSYLAPAHADAISTDARAVALGKLNNKPVSVGHPGRCIKWARQSGCGAGNADIQPCACTRMHLWHAVAHPGICARTSASHLAPASHPILHLLRRHALARLLAFWASLERCCQGLTYRKARDPVGFGSGKTGKCEEENAFSNSFRTLHPPPHRIGCCRLSLDIHYNCYRAPVFTTTATALPCSLQLLPRSRPPVAPPTSPLDPSLLLIPAPSLFLRTAQTISCLLNVADPSPEPLEGHLEQ